MCDDPLSNVREMVRKHAKQYSNEIDCTCIGVCKQEPTILCKALHSRAKMDEQGTVVTSRRRPRCARPGRAATGLGGRDLARVRQRRRALLVRSHVSLAPLTYLQASVVGAAASEASLILLLVSTGAWPLTSVL